jgi:hypothetical protein
MSVTKKTGAVFSPPERTGERRTENSRCFFCQAPQKFKFYHTDKKSAGIFLSDIQYIGELRSQKFVRAAAFLVMQISK